jgi:hypothetical protein
VEPAFLFPSRHALRDWGFANADLDQLRKCGAIS